MSDKIKELKITIKLLTFISITKKKKLFISWALGNTNTRPWHCVRVEVGGRYNPREEICEVKIL